MHEPLSFDWDFHGHCAVREMQTDPFRRRHAAFSGQALNACGNHLHRLNNQLKP
jgi:hypothetical protein